MKVVSKDTFEKLSKHDLSCPAVDRSIAPEKIAPYLATLSPEQSYHAERIIAQTRYVRYDECLVHLRHLASKLPPAFNILFQTNDKIGSEHWLTVLLWPDIKSQVHKVFNNFTEITEADTLPIVLLDDAMYSGHSMTNIIDDFRFSYKDRTGQKSKHEFIVMVMFATKHAITLLRTVSPVTVIYSELLQPYSTDSELMYKLFRCEHDCVPLYFDHKIANEFGSFPMIYKHILKALPSRAGIVRLEKLLRE